jgi:hypothetical protein
LAVRQHTRRCHARSLNPQFHSKVNRLLLLSRRTVLAAAVFSPLRAAAKPFEPHHRVDTAAPAHAHDVVLTLDA